VPATRRDVLRALAASAAALATGGAFAAPASGWPAFVSPFVEHGIGAGLGLWRRGDAPAARLDLPARAHAVTLHPDKCSCVAVARRPGRFGLGVDLARFERSVTFEATDGRHFFGHGVFADAGRLFLTTENDFDGARGMIGVRDAASGFRFAGEWESGGIGPHDLVVGADGRHLFVANGGIDMGPDTGRAKLNEGLIASSIARIDIGSGRLEAFVTLGEDNASLSIRHLASTATGAVAFGCQETMRDAEARPLVGVVETGDRLRFMQPPDGGWTRLAGYIGEVACDAASGTVAATAPLAGLCAVWRLDTGAPLALVPLADCCGLAPAGSGYVLSSGRGQALRIGDDVAQAIVETDLGFDNHLAVLGA
jgi:hypothetical protein